MLAGRWSRSVASERRSQVGCGRGFVSLTAGWRRAVLGPFRSRIAVCGGCERCTIASQVGNQGHSPGLWHVYGQGITPWLLDAIISVQISCSNIEGRSILINSFFF